MSRERKRIAGAEKLAILKRYLAEKVPISDLCDKHAYDRREGHAAQSRHENRDAFRFDDQTD